MSEAAGFRVQGAGEVARALAGIAADLEEGPSSAALAAVAEAAVRARTPRLSGALAGSLRGEVVKGGIVVTAPLDYAGPINYGWPARGIAPAAFMQAADPTLVPLSVRLIEAGINASIRKRGLS